MASFSTTYVGKDATGLLQRGIISSPTLAQGGLKIYEFVKGSANIRLVDIAETAWVEDDGEFTDQNKLDFNSKNILLVNRKINEKILKSEIATDWASADMAKGATGMISGQTRQAIDNEIVNMVANANDAFIWDTLTPSIISDVDAEKVDLTLITVNNVIEMLNKMTSEYGEKTNNLGTAKLYMNPRIQAMYNSAQAGLGNNDARGFKADNFGGYPIISSIKINPDNLFITPFENLAYLTDLKSDLNSVKFIDQSPITGANHFRIAANVSMAVDYVRGSEIVMGRVV